MIPQQITMSGIWKDTERDNCSLLWNSLFTAWNLVMSDHQDFVSAFVKWQVIRLNRLDASGWIQKRTIDIQRGTFYKHYKVVQALPEREDWGIWPFRKKAGTNQFITTDWLNRLLVFLAGNMEPEIPWDFAKRMQGKEINKNRPKRKRSDAKRTAENWKAMSGNCVSSFKGKEKTWYRGPLIKDTVRLSINDQTSVWKEVRGFEDRWRKSCGSDFDFSPMHFRMHLFLENDSHQHPPEQPKGSECLGTANKTKWQPETTAPSCRRSFKRCLKRNFKMWKAQYARKHLDLKKDAPTKKSSPKSEFHRSCKLTDQPIFNRRMKEETRIRPNRFPIPRWKHLELSKELFLKSEEVLLYNTNLNI